MKIIKYFICSLISVLTVFSSCKVGLGIAVDLEPPQVEILTPDFMKNVPLTFDVSGRAADAEGVEKIELYVADSLWLYSKGKWTCRENENSQWKDVDSQDAEFLNLGEGKSSWHVNVTLPENAQGEIIIKAVAYDAMGNCAKESVSQRTVVYDRTPPVVSLIRPVVKFYDSSEIAAAYDIIPDHKDFSNISYFHNEKIELQGYQDESFTLGNFQLCLFDASGLTCYYDSEEDEEGTAEINQNLRNWNLTIPAEKIRYPASFQDEQRRGTAVKEKTYMQIVTTSADAAGNVETRSQGWICWWPESDKPWVEFSSAGAQTESAIDYYPGSEFQGQCYDDDGIGSVSISIFKEDGISLLYSKTFDNISGTENQTFYNLSVELSQENLGIKLESGVYLVQSQITDINGNLSDTVSGFIKIKDITVPVVKAVLLPLENEPLFGDENGNVSVKVSVCDDTDVAGVKLVWIKKEEDAVKYLNFDYKNWNDESCFESGKDFAGNKLWNLSLSLPGDADENDLIPYIAETSFNIFDDLKAGEETELKPQRFIFRVTDSTGKGSTFDFVTAGDSESPVIKIESFEIQGVETYSNVKEISGSIVSLQGHKVCISGTWEDNSTKHWSDKEKIEPVELKWNEKTITVETDFNNGTWTTGFIDPESGTTISLTASQKDYAGNIGTDSVSLQTSSDAPALMGITSDRADGTYGAGVDFIITLKFNKNVTFSGGSNPDLTLSNNKTAVYFNGNKTNSHQFKYTSAEDDDISDLNVLSINTNGNTWKANSDNSKVDMPVTLDDLVNGNLADSKNINIVTKKPAVSEMYFEDNGNSLCIEFNHSVVKNQGSITFVQQESNLKVPAILTADEYERLCFQDPAFADYYSAGTNGCSADGAQDLTTKYILQYEKELTDPILVQKYIDAKAHVVTVDVVSSAVELSGETMTIDLSSTYRLKVKGAVYKVFIDAGLVSDDVNNENFSYTEDLVLSGVEKPVIRVKMTQPEFNSVEFTAIQPEKGAFRIDTNTPGAEIYFAKKYKTFSVEDEAAALNLGVSANTDYPLPGLFTEAGNPDTLYDGEQTVGEETVDGLEFWQWGAKYAVSAVAKKDSEESEKAYNTAYKSVFVFDDDGGALKTGFVEAGRRVWLRGGDSETGTVLTAGFPLSWDALETEKAALLTQDTEISGGKMWYYVTWSLPTKAYLTLLTGTAVDAVSGPVNYCWSTNAWVPFRQFYPLYPGESRIVKSSAYGNVWGKERGTLLFSGEKYGGQASGGGGNEWDMYKTGDSTDPVASNSNPGTELLTSSVDFANDTLIKRKLNFNGVIKGTKLYIQTAASSKKNPKKIYLELFAIHNGAKHFFGEEQISVTPGALLVYDLPDDVETYQYDAVYLGGLGVKVTSVKIVIPVTSHDPVTGEAVHENSNPGVELLTECKDYPNLYYNGPLSLSAANFIGVTPGTVVTIVLEKTLDAYPSGKYAYLKFTGNQGNLPLTASDLQGSVDNVISVVDGEMRFNSDSQTITWTLNDSAILQIRSFNSWDTIQVNGYGVKITSLKLNIPE